MYSVYVNVFKLVFVYQIVYVRRSYRSIYDVTHTSVLSKCQSYKQKIYCTNKTIDNQDFT